MTSSFSQTKQWFKELPSPSGLQLCVFVPWTMHNFKVGRFIIYVSSYYSHNVVLRSYEHLWHEQEKWVTCRQHLNLSFLYNAVHLKCYNLVQTPLQSLQNPITNPITSGCRDSNNSLNFQYNIKPENFASLLAYISKSILTTSNLFPLIMSHFTITQTVINFLYCYWMLLSCQEKSVSFFEVEKVRLYSKFRLVNIYVVFF